MACPQAAPGSGLAGQLVPGRGAFVFVSWVVVMEETTGGVHVACPGSPGASGTNGDPQRPGPGPGCGSPGARGPGCSSGARGPERFDVA